MSYDNRIFNVNGSGEAGLLVAMTLAFDQKGFPKFRNVYCVCNDKGVTSDTHEGDVAVAHADQRSPKEDQH